MVYKDSVASVNMKQYMTDCPCRPPLTGSYPAPALSCPPPPLPRADQSVVEKMLTKEGSSRQQLGREAFTQRVWQWKEE